MTQKALHRLPFGLKGIIEYDDAYQVPHTVPGSINDQYYYHTLEMKCTQVIKPIKYKRACKKECEESLLLYPLSGPLGTLPMIQNVLVLN